MDDGLLLTVTGSTKRPIQIVFKTMPTSDTLVEAILDRIPDRLYHDDVHGKPAWRKQMTLRLAEEIRVELRDARP
jgi:RNAse (barnase) inhibitor barstar